MSAKFWLVLGFVFGFSPWKVQGAAVGAASTERAYLLNDTSAEMTDSAYPADITDQPGPPDSHEAMNNRDFRHQERRKRSFEFLMGLVSNNSKYEVIRSDPEMKPERLDNQTSSNNRRNNSDATKLLLDLLSKIVAYPDHWRQIHQVLRSLDQDLISSENIVRHKQEEDQKHLKEFHMELKRKLKEDQLQRLNVISSTATNKWPNFDDIEENTVSTNTETFRKDERVSERSIYQKNFAYHKVTVSGKPAHLKKTPTAYIAVSAISAKSSEPEEDFLLETELHQLKPWKNKLLRV